jgi:Tol biopolymer transport system component
MTRHLLLVLLALGVVACEGRSTRAPSGLLSPQQQDPALSGNGRLLAVIEDQNGRPTVQLRNVEGGGSLRLRHLSRHQPHSSPSLSWNGRYLAVITQRGNHRLVLIEDRLSGKAHPLRLPSGRDPVQVSLAPDARKLAIQTADQGRWRVEVIDLSGLLEPDGPGGQRSTTPSEPNR